MGNFINQSFLLSNKSSKELTDYLLYEKNIFVAPGFIFGKNGEGYIRFSLCLDEQLIIKAKSRLKWKLE